MSKTHSSRSLLAVLVTDTDAPVTPGWLFQFSVDSTHLALIRCTVTVVDPVQSPTWYSFSRHEAMVALAGGGDFNHRNERSVPAPGASTRSHVPAALFCAGAVESTQES